jgi:MSHA biogenesis protein MshJ
VTQWQLLSEKFSQLQQREKLWLSVGVIFLTLWLLLIYLLEPAWLAGQQAQKQLSTLQQQQSDAKTQADTLRRQLSVNMDQKYLEQIAVLQQQEQQLNAEIKQSAAHFVGSEQMISLLQNILQSSSGVQVTSLSTLPAQPVRLAGQTDDEAALLYQHTITLVMNGSYAKLHAVLQRIEHLPGLINHAGLEYRVLQYPQAELSLKLSTVSEYEDFIRL